MASNPQAKILLFAPTNILVDQHSDTFKEYLENVYPVKATGTVDPTFENPGVYIITAAYTVVLLRKRLLDLRCISYIVYDQAHKAISQRAPYSLISKLYPGSALALTASPGSNNNLKTILRNLNLSTIVTAQTPFTHQKELNLVPLNQDPKVLKIVQMIREKVYNKFVLLIKALEIPMNMSPSYLINRYPLSSVSLKLRSHRVTNREYYIFLKYLFYIHYLLFQDIFTFSVYYEKNKELAPLSRTVFYLLQKYYKNKKFENIHNILKNLKEGADTSVLVFFENWDTCNSFRTHLVQGGQKEEDIALLAGKSKLKTKQRDLVLEQIRNGIKIILSTSVIEEGINIKSVDHVVFFKPISSKIRIIQREGRTARYRSGQISVLYYKNTSEQSIVAKSY